MFCRHPGPEFGILRNRRERLVLCNNLSVALVELKLLVSLQCIVCNQPVLQINGSQAEAKLLSTFAPGCTLPE